MQHHRGVIVLRGIPPQARVRASRRRKETQVIDEPPESPERWNEIPAVRSVIALNFQGLLTDEEMARVYHRIRERMDKQSKKPAAKVRGAYKKKTGKAKVSSGGSA